MKKIILSLAVILGIFSTSLFGQQKQIMIYTKIKMAKFVPYINNHAMTNSPVDTFIYNVDTTHIVNLTINFADKRINDLFIPIDFQGIKSKKYQIVYKNKRQKTISILDNAPQNDTLLDLFILKNESFKNYLKNITNQ